MSSRLSKKLVSLLASVLLAGGVTVISSSSASADVSDPTPVNPPAISLVYSTCAAPGQAIVPADAPGQYVYNVYRYDAATDAYTTVIRNGNSPQTSLPPGYYSVTVTASDGYYVASGNTESQFWVDPISPNCNVVETPFFDPRGEIKVSKARVLRLKLDNLRSNVIARYRLSERTKSGKVIKKTYVVNPGGRKVIRLTHRKPGSRFSLAATSPGFRNTVRIGNVVVPKARH